MVMFFPADVTNHSNATQMEKKVERVSKQIGKGKKGKRPERRGGSGKKERK